MANYPIECLSSFCGHTTESAHCKACASRPALDAYKREEAAGRIAARGSDYTEYTNNKPMARTISTPWGVSQVIEKETLPGLVFISTASHGGYKVSAERWAELLQAFPAFKSFAGAGWLEEDCDAALPPLVWPEAFTDQDIHNALRSIGGRDDLPGFIISDRYKMLLARADRFRASVAGSWEVGSMGSAPRGYPRGCWWVSIRRGSDRRDIVLRDYPTKQYLTDAELMALEAQPEATADKKAVQQALALGVMI